MLFHQPLDKGGGIGGTVRHVSAGGSDNFGGQPVFFRNIDGAAFAGYAHQYPVRGAERRFVK